MVSKKSTLTALTLFTFALFGTFLYSFVLKPHTFKHTLDQELLRVKQQTPLRITNSLVLLQLKYDKNSLLYIYEVDTKRLKLGLLHQQILRENLLNHSCKDKSIKLLFKHKLTLTYIYKNSFNRELFKALLSKENCEQFFLQN